MTDADACRELVTPKLVAAGWGTSDSVIGEQHSFTNGRIIVAGGGKVRRGKQRRADDLLHCRRDFPLTVVEVRVCCILREPGATYPPGRRFNKSPCRVHATGREHAVAPAKVSKSASRAG